MRMKIRLLLVIILFLSACGNPASENVSGNTEIDNVSGTLFATVQEVAEEDTGATDLQIQDLTSLSAEELLDEFVSGNIMASYGKEGLNPFYITDLSFVEDDVFGYSIGDKVDLDNDGELELILEDPYGGMYLDARAGAVYVLDSGGGRSAVLSYTAFDGQIWIVHSDTTHAGRNIYEFTRYDGLGTVQDNFQLTHEFWETPDIPDAPSAVYTYRGEAISREEYMILLEKMLYIPIPEEDKILPEEELLSIVSETSGQQIEQYAYIDMDNDGASEMLAICTMDNGKFSAWYCSSNGTICKSVFESDADMDTCQMELISFENETHVVLNTFRFAGTGKYFTILALKNKEIINIVSNEYGYVQLNDDGDITLTVDAYDGSYDPNLDMLMGHTWKDTYLYYDGESYKEYVATEISQSEFYQYNYSAEALHVIWDELELITPDITKIDYSFFIRENGVLHIQCDIYDSSGYIEYGYYTFRYSEKTLSLAGGEICYGQMQPSFSSLGY